MKKPPSKSALRSRKAKAAWKRRKEAAAKVMAEKSTPAKRRAAMQISDALIEATAQRRSKELIPRIFAAAQPMPGVVPANDKRAMMAMDTAIKRAAQWAAGALDQQIVFAGGWGGVWGGSGYGAFAEGQEFLGYPYLATLSQRPEYRFIVETIATEMTRKWIKIEAAGGDEAATSKTDKVKKLEDEFNRLQVQECFAKMAEDDGYFGRAHLFVDTGTSIESNNPELATPIGDGLNQITANKIAQGSIKRLQPVEAVWTYPTLYNSNNPLSPDWYKPDMWFVMGTRVHVSRLLPFIGREVPDVLKPAYSFGGLSMSQMVKPYVDNFLRTRQSVSDLLHAFSVFVLSSNLAETLTQGGEQLFRRAALFNNMRDNKGLMMVDKDTEDLKNVSVPLAGLDALQAQSQEHMASASRIPLVKLLGISPAGLNASSEGELRTFYDTIAAFQKKFFAPNLDRIFRFAQINLWGAVDPDLSYSFVDLWAMDEKQQAEVRKINADTGAILVETGAIDATEERERVAAEEGSPYAGLDLTKVIIPPEDVGSELGGINQGGGLGGSPDDFQEAAE